MTDDEENELKEDCILVKLYPKNVEVARIVLYYEITDKDIEKIIKKLIYITQERNNQIEKWLVLCILRSQSS